MAEREAAYYTPLPDRAVICNLCPHACRLGEGRKGFCHNRTNRNGKLYADGYGKVCALHIDPVEKKPLLHFHPGDSCLSVGIAGCNLACLNCQNWVISQASPQDTACRYVTPEEFAKLALDNNCRLVAYTYTEPLTWWEYTFDCAVACRQQGLQNILVTAGYINDAPLYALLPYIDAANVDLKSFSDEIYHRISRAHLQPVLHTLELMRDARIWIEITNLLIPGVNDDPKLIQKMCQWLVANGFSSYPLHFSRFFPLYRLQDRPPTPDETLLQAQEIAHEAGMQFVYLGNTQLPDAENTYCPQCGNLIVKRNGYHVEYALPADGKCPHCGKLIPGVWR